MLSERLIDSIVGLPRVIKRIIVFSIDAGLCVLATWLAFYLRVGEFVALSQGGWQAALLSLVALPILAFFELYRIVFRHFGMHAFVRIAQAGVVYGIFYSVIVTAFSIVSVPRTVGIIQPLLLVLLISLSRLAGNYWLGGAYRQHLGGRRHLKNVLIYGAGGTGRQLVDALGRSGVLRVRGFVDDDCNLRGGLINGLRVWHPNDLELIVDRLEIDQVMLAIPTATRQRRSDILKRLQTMGLEVKTVPGMLELAYGKVSISDVRALEVDDLLGREVVKPDATLIGSKNHGKVVLVTGAGGSIGSELCRQILRTGPRILLLLEISEFALYSIHQELEFAGAELDAPVVIIPLLGSVCDEDRLRDIFARWRPETVYHAAAYKHVPMVEHNTIEGVRNNVVGTWRTAAIALQHGTHDFVLISTDKAVRPTNIMGASKRMAELFLQSMANEQTCTRFSMVRFGNVLGSSGSVVPLFRRQIAHGGPVTVTHPEITRYFMTIPEAAQLVLQAGAMARGGEVFVLDMGEPVRVLELARSMIQLAGLQVRNEHQEGDIEIKFTGLRPGEKLYEELLIGDSPQPTPHPRILMARERFIPAAEMEAHGAVMLHAIGRRDPIALRKLVETVVPEFAPTSDCVDWLYSAPQTDVDEGPAGTSPESSSLVA